jgi:DNA-binding NarL/FixJ family response regulator
MGSPETTAQLRIAVFDDNAEIRAALWPRIAQDPRVDEVVCAAASDIDAMPGVIEKLRPNVALIDPGRGGIETSALRTLLALRRDGECLIAMHVVHPDEEGKRSALKAGCDLYIPKGMRTAALLNLLAGAVERHGTALADPDNQS